MLEYQQIPGTNILELTLDGKFTHQQFEDVKAQLERMFDVHGKVRILEVIRNVGVIEPRALWEDLTFGPKHMRDFSHVAVVADQKWVEWMTAAIRPFISPEVRFYRLAEIEHARHWLREASDQGQTKPPEPTAPAAPPGS